MYFWFLLLLFILRRIYFKLKYPISAQYLFIVPNYSCLNTNIELYPNCVPIKVSWSTTELCVHIYYDGFKMCAKSLNRRLVFTNRLSLYYSKIYKVCHQYD